MVGDGKDREDGSTVRVGMAWCALNDGTIAEVWFNADGDDTEGTSVANKIMNSLQAP